MEEAKTLHWYDDADHIKFKEILDHVVAFKDEIALLIHTCEDFVGAQAYKELVLVYDHDIKSNFCNSRTEQMHYQQVYALAGL